jgi:hypothetical protein
MTSSFQKPSRVLPNVAGQSSALHQVVGDFWKQQVQRPAATRQKTVRVPGLRHSPTAHIFQGEAITIKDRHAGVVVAQDTGGEQSRHAATDYEGVFPCRSSAKVPRRGSRAWIRYRHRLKFSLFDAHQDFLSYVWD